MKKLSYLKALSLSLLILLGLSATAQQKSDDFFRSDFDNYENRSAVAIWAATNGIQHDDFGESPLGNGLLVMLAAGASYAILRRRRNFKKGTTLLLVALMLIGMTNCKKNIVEPIAQPTGGNKVAITLNVGGGAKAEVDPPHVNFEVNDKILVAHDGKYVGTLTYTEYETDYRFEGNIDASVAEPAQKLYFYFLGNMQNDASLTAGSTTSCTVNISNQTGYPTLPVISFSASNEDFTGSGAYSTRLHNKASLMKFNVTTDSDAAICITGMNNKVTVDFSKAASDGDNNGFSYNKEGEGVIKMKGGSGSPAEKWAIVLPQDASPAARAYTTDNAYIGTRPAMDAITANQYIESGFAIEVNTAFNPYETPLTLEAVENGTITFDNQATGPVTYTVNGGLAQTIAASTTGNIPVNAGDNVCFYGDNATYVSGKYSRISCSADCYIYGNIMSLINSTDYANVQTLTANFAFKRLFTGNSHIVNHPSKTLELPATTLANYCYEEMFNGCTSLTNAPELPATTLVVYCYSGMFLGCTNLTTAPSLPATTIHNNCYSNMFKNCTSLTTAPSLPATTMKDHCYTAMFQGCTSLTTAPALSATSLDNYCYSYMFDGCTSLKNAPELPATTLYNQCYSHMFSGCTSLETAPTILPATTMKYCCYEAMFYGCTSLKNAPELRATTLYNSCCYSMFSGCTSLETAPALPATSLVNWCYAYMFRGCTSLTTAPELPASALSEGCYSSMFKDCSNLTSVTCLATSGINTDNSTTDWLNGVAATGTFTKAEGADWPDGVNGIPTNWVVQNN